MKKNTTGHQIKSFASFLRGLGILTAILGGLFCFSFNPFMGLVVIIVGCYLAWQSTLCLMGFGELIEDTTANREINERILDVLESMYTRELEADAAKHSAPPPSSDPVFVEEIEPVFVEKTYPRSATKTVEKHNPLLNGLVISVILLFVLIIVGVSTSSTAKPAATAKPTKKVVATAVPTKKAVVTAAPAKNPFVSATPKRTKKATATPTASPTWASVAAMKATPTPTATPTAVPTATPTAKPIPAPEYTSIPRLTDSQSLLFTMFSNDSVGATKHIVVGGQYEPSGKYEVVCASGHGVLSVNGKGFCFAADRYKGTANGSKTYEGSTIITLNANDTLSLRNFHSSNVTLYFYYVGE